MGTSELTLNILDLSSTKAGEGTLMLNILLASRKKTLVGAPELGVVSETGTTPSTVFTRSPDIPETTPLPEILLESISHRQSRAYLWSGEARANWTLESRDWSTSRGTTLSASGCSRHSALPRTGNLSPNIRKKKKKNLTRRPSTKVHRQMQFWDLAGTSNLDQKLGGDAGR